MQRECGLKEFKMFMELCVCGGAEIARGAGASQRKHGKLKRRRFFASRCGCATSSFARAMHLNQALTMPLFDAHSTAIQYAARTQRALPSFFNKAAPSRASTSRSTARWRILTARKSTSYTLVMRELEELEQRAAQAHLRAQQFNKQGDFEGAKACYAEMSALESEALALAREVSAAADGGGGGSDGGAAATTTLDAALSAAPPLPAAYNHTLVPCSWRDAAARLGGDASSAQQQQLRARAHAAVVGAAVADAAATPVQWIYDTSELTSLLNTEHERERAPTHGGVGVEFWPVTISSFFKDAYSVGRASPYGEETRALLRALAGTGEEGASGVVGLNAAAYAARLEADLGGAFDGYTNAPTRHLLRARALGLSPPATGATDDAQANCVTRLAPLIAFGAGDARLMAAVEVGARVTQNCDRAVAWGCAGAAVLERLIAGAGAGEAIAATIEELQVGDVAADAADSDRRRLRTYGLAADIAKRLQAVLDAAATPHGDVVDALGRNCHTPNSAQTPLHAVLQAERALVRLAGGVGAASAEQRQAAFASSIRGALLGGGCCASRAGFAGACLGALLGAEGVPLDWRARCDDYAEVAALAERVCAARD